MIDELFPNSGYDLGAEMRRRSVVGHVKDIIGEIWAWGPGATKSRTLRGAIHYYGNLGCVRAETVLAIEDLFNEYVDGGLDLNLSHLSRDQRAALLSPLRVAVDEYGRRVDERRRLSA